MNRFFKSTIALMTLLSIGCDNEVLIVPDADLPAVRAYIYAGQKVNEINITSTLALDDESESAPPVNDAEVSLLKLGSRYDLFLSEGDSGYYHYDGDDLTIEAGDTFDLEIAWAGKILTGTTVVPPKPPGAELSVDTMVVPVIESRQDFIDWIRADDNRTTITWENEDRNYYYITFDNVEEEPESIELQLPSRFRRIITEPFRSSSYTLSSAAITHYGDHELVLYRVNEEYVMLYETSGQDSRDLNEPFSNIDGGLGVFAAFNSDTLKFTVTKVRENGDGEL